VNVTWRTYVTVGDGYGEGVEVEVKVGDGPAAKVAADVTVYPYSGVP